MSDKKERNGKSIEWYVAEWNSDDGLGWVVRETAKGTGLSLTETLLFFNYMERWAVSDLARQQLALQTEAMERLRAHDDSDESWKAK